MKVLVGLFVLITLTFSMKTSDSHYIYIDTDQLVSCIHEKSIEIISRNCEMCTELSEIDEKVIEIECKDIMLDRLRPECKKNKMTGKCERLYALLTAALNFLEN